MNLTLKGLAAILAIACVCTSLSSGQKKTIKFSEYRVVHLNGVEMAHLLAQLAADYVSERVKDEKLSFDLSGLTLRQAFNRIAEDSGAKFWVFRRYADGTFEITLSCC